MESFATQLGSAACKIGALFCVDSTSTMLAGYSRPIRPPRPTSDPALMPRIPAPAVRALTVLALGTAFVVSHIHLAVAAPAMKAEVRTGGLAENCYLDTKIEVTAAGKRIVRRIVECD